MADPRTPIRYAVERMLTPIHLFREWLEDGMPLPGSGSVGIRDRRRWREATSLEDLCTLTVGWLSGEIRTHPGYYGPVDVDEDYAPGLTAALIALNRMGFLTRQSQAGYDGPGDDDWSSTSCAAVEGFATPATARKLQTALARTRFEIRVETTRPPDAPFIQGQPVTHLEGSPCTWFGGRLSAEEIEFDFEGTSEAAVASVQETVQVTIQDPTAGPNDLWTYLEVVATTTTQAETTVSHPTSAGIQAARGPEATAPAVACSPPGQDVEHPMYITIGRYRVPVNVPSA